MAMKRLPTSALADFFFHPLEEILLVDVGFKRAARLAGDDADRAGEIELRFDGFDLRRIGGIQNVQSRDSPRFSQRSCRSTSGHRLEPPMPRSSACLNSGFLDVRGDVLADAEMCASCSSVMPSQPSHLLSSVPVQSEASFCHKAANFFVLFPIVLGGGERPGERSSGVCSVCRFRLTRARQRSCRWPPAVA